MSRIIVGFLIFNILIGSTREIEMEDNFGFEFKCPEGATCKLVKECSLALKYLRTTGRHPLTTCGYISANEIVCCPETYYYEDDYKDDHKTDYETDFEDYQEMFSEFKCPAGGAACKLVKECSLALKYLKTTGRHPLTTCGYIGANEIVCCPETYYYEDDYEDDHKTDYETDFEDYQEMFSEFKCPEGGTCKLVKVCDLAREYLKASGRHNLTTCGYIGKKEIVCCPEVVQKDDYEDYNEVHETIFSDTKCQKDATCELVEHCDLALKYPRTFGGHNLTTCGFIDTKEVVCCPKSITESSEGSGTEDNCPKPAACKLVKDCDLALKYIRTSGGHNFTTCGFIGTNEIVCCPAPFTSTISLSNISGNAIPRQPFISNYMCQKIKNKYKKYIDKKKITPHIMKGNYCKLGEFPHMVSIGTKDGNGNVNGSICGASLISSRHLLSAAHCFTCVSCVNDTKQIRARLGVFDITNTSSAQEIGIKTLIIHPHYNAGTHHNDLVILELAESVTMSNIIYPVCLYSELNDPAPLTASGWGATENARSSTVLRKATLEPVPVEQCHISVVSKTTSVSSITIDDTQICANSKNNADTCDGDSGGPLVFEQNSVYYLVGITSFGLGCGSAEVPGIYTRVAKYLDWIEPIVWSDLNENSV